MKPKVRSMVCTNCKATIDIHELKIVAEWKVPRYCPYCGERDLVNNTQIKMLSGALELAGRDDIDKF
jgi:predicted RNA-binding Zn-ribbon protein involved in translation (DUF1610 family)